MRQFLIILLVLGLSPLAAQLPVTKVFSFELERRDTAFTFSNPQYLTAFNPNGYNNQPSFVDDDVMLMAVQYPEMPQPDIFSFDLSARTQTRVTRTRSGEYSPKPIGDGSRFSAVRQEYLGRDTVLRVWEFPTNRVDNGRPVFKYLNGTGYYSWLNSHQLALFLTGSPSQLVLGDVTTDKTVPLAENPGRSFDRLPNGNLIYVQKSNATGAPWLLMEKSLYKLNQPARTLVETLPGSEDFIVLNDGTVLMANGSKIYHFDPIRDRNWREIVDLRFYGIRKLSRLAYNGRDRIAVVTE
ncbi:hypothetical protein CEQ90_14125 [Lewinellaceae bacterium SD302]|nr:hypothetical protein CEQ90_14125 [Lewinellaceae bacterium SD302]